MAKLVTRRAALATGVLGSAGLLAGCDRVQKIPAVRDLLFSGEDAQQALQRTWMAKDALAREYPPEAMSPLFRTNGTTQPTAGDYPAMAANNFADWKLKVDGLVKRPLAISLAQLRAMPNRTQITRHDCVEGWSAIGQWTGPQLSFLLNLAGLRDGARYIVFHCADVLLGSPYYESIDLVDAYHPQTILAWGMNGDALSVGHGAPVRLRVERQLGYKQAKFVMRVEAVASLAGIGQGKGGLWEDKINYAWYAGI